MRGAFLRATKIIAVTLTFFLVCVVRVFSQVHERYEGWCETLRDASSPELVKFLNSVTLEEGNARCVAWVIHKLGKERYHPAIVPLVGFSTSAFHKPKGRGYPDGTGTKSSLLRKHSHVSAKKPFPRFFERLRRAHPLIPCARTPCLSGWRYTGRPTNMLRESLC